MKFNLIVRGRLFNKKLDDFMSSVNNSMSLFGFDEKIKYSQEIANTTVTINGLTVDDYKSLSKEKRNEIETMFKEEGEKQFSKHFADVSIEVTGPFE